MHLLSHSQAQAAQEALHPWRYVRRCCCRLPRLRPAQICGCHCPLTRLPNRPAVLRLASRLHVTVKMPLRWRRCSRLRQVLPPHAPAVTEQEP